MIAWWGWLLIWVGLSLALVAMLVIMGIILFRKVMGLFAALETLGDKLEILERASEVVDGHREQLAILAGEEATRQRRDRVRAAAHARRDARHDRRIVRAKAAIGVDASTREWFPKNLL